MSASTQPCSPGCAGFREFPDDPWGSYGICLHPGSAKAGFPTLIGSECPWFAARGPTDGEGGALEARPPAAK